MLKWTVFQFKYCIVTSVIWYFDLTIGLWHWLRLIEYFPFVWLRHSRHLPLGYCIVSLYLFIKYKGQLVELHKLWGQFQANLNLGWCLSLCNSSRSVISLPVLLNVSSHRHWLDWLIFFETSSCLLKFNLICFIIVLIDLYYCILLFCIICETWLLQILMRVLHYS